MARIAGRVVIYLVAMVAVAFLVDWGVWRLRVANGGGMGRVSVSRLQVAPLKGNKEEYYYDGTEEVDCSRSIFPEAGSGACWWLERHKVVFYR